MPSRRFCKMAMYSMFKRDMHKKLAEAADEKRKLHFGKEHDGQRTYEMLMTGKDLRDSKAPIAHSRFSDWVSTKVATGELLQPDQKKELTVHQHTFRDRDRSLEVGERAFGVYYEKEKSRVDRRVEEQRADRLQREAWFRNQHGPAKPTATRKLTGTSLNTRHFTDAERINASVEHAGTFDMHAGHGWRKFREPEFRPRKKEGQPTRPLTHGTDDQVWEPQGLPHAVLEPYRDMGRHEHLNQDPPVLSQKRTGASHTRFDFSPKEHGRTRCNFALVVPAPKPEPTIRKKRYCNSMRGVTCFLPHAYTSTFEGDVDAKKHATEVLVNL